MAPSTSVRDARYGRTGGNSKFLAKLKKSHELGRANSAHSQMRATNKHNARVSALVKKSFGEDKEGRMTNWMDDDVREAVIDALIEVELTEKKQGWVHPHATPPTKNQARLSAGKAWLSDKASKGRDKVSSAASKAASSTKTGARRAKIAAHKRTPMRGRVAIRKGINAGRSAGRAVKGSPSYMSKGVRDVASGARDLVRHRKGGATAGRGDRINAMRRTDARNRLKGGAGGAALATAGAAAATYGAYRGGKALKAKYKARKARKAQEESYDVRGDYHNLMESLIGE